ncbi:MAG: hypothetical protein IT432_00745 [Phycisphaerales bacterium]|nr:hypothetical protein [Phycisphaerales bacterium]
MKSLLRARALASFHQPQTVLQMARRLHTGVDRVGYVFWELVTGKLIECLNARARQSRVYWLTAVGARCQARVRRALGLRPLSYSLPSLDWSLFGWVLFRHRSAVVSALDHPLRPSDIKRQARRRDERLRMSANNVREIIKLFLERGLVRPVKEPREHHPRYELTDAGRAVRTLLLSTGGAAATA